MRRLQEWQKRKKGQGDQLFFENQMSAESARKLAADVMETWRGYCAVFCGNDQDGYRYAIGKKRR